MSEENKQKRKEYLKENRKNQFKNVLRRKKKMR